jgi:hypothetical protein
MLNVSSVKYLVLLCIAGSFLAADAGALQLQAVNPTVAFIHPKYPIPIHPFPLPTPAPLTTAQQASQACLKWFGDAIGRAVSIQTCYTKDVNLFNTGAARDFSALCTAIGVSDFNTCVGLSASAADADISAYCNGPSTGTLNNGSSPVTPSAATVASELTTCQNDVNAVKATCAADVTDWNAQQKIINDANAAIAKAQAAQKVDKAYLNANACANNPAN